MSLSEIARSDFSADVYQITCSQVSTLKAIPSKLNSSLAIPISPTKVALLAGRLEMLGGSLETYNQQNCFWKLLNLIMSIFTGVFCNVCKLRGFLRDLIDRVQTASNAIKDRFLSLNEHIAKKINEECEKKLMQETTPEKLVAMLDEDRDTAYSHVILDDKTEALKAFIVARESQESFYNKYAGKVTAMEKLWVAPDERRHGLAKKLLHTVAERAVERNVDQIRLLVYHVNEIAIQVYVKLGFEYDDKARDDKFDAYVLVIKPWKLLKTTAPKA